MVWTSGRFGGLCTEKQGDENRRLLFQELHGWLSVTEKDQSKGDGGLCYGHSSAAASYGNRYEADAMAEQEAEKAAMQYLQVKTLSPKVQDPDYLKTYAFYERMGFCPLEVLPLWDEWNPCQLMVKYIAMKQQPALCKP